MNDKDYKRVQTNLGMDGQGSTKDNIMLKNVNECPEHSLGIMLLTRPYVVHWNFFFFFFLQELYMNMIASFEK